MIIQNFIKNKNKKQLISRVLFIFLFLLSLSVKSQNIDSIKSEIFICNFKTSQNFNIKIEKNHSDNKLKIKFFIQMKDYKIRIIPDFEDPYLRQNIKDCFVNDKKHGIWKFMITINLKIPTKNKIKLYGKI